MHSPVVLLDGTNSRFLVLYEREEVANEPDSCISGRFVGSDRSVAQAEFPVSGTIAHDDLRCFSAAGDAGSGGFLVTWRTPSRIISRTGNAGGTMSADFAIADTDSGWGCPSVVFDGVNGQYLVAWSDGQYQTSAVHAQRVTADGVVAGPRIFVSDHVVYGGRLSTAFDDDDSRFLVVMEGKTSIYGQLVNADGTLSGATTTLSDERSTYPSNPSVAYDGVNKRFLASWQNYPLIEGRLVGTDGLPLGATFVISNTGLDFSRQELVFDPADQRYLDVLGQNGDYYWKPSPLFGQLMNADGTLYGTSSDVNFRISPPDVSGEWNARAVFDNTGGEFFVVSEYKPGFFSWEYEDTSGARYADIHGQFVNPDGTLDGPVIVITRGGP